MNAIAAPNPTPMSKLGKYRKKRKNKVWYIHIYIYINRAGSSIVPTACLRRAYALQYVAYASLRELTRAEGPKDTTKNSLRGLTRLAFLTSRLGDPQMRSATRVLDTCGSSSAVLADAKINRCEWAIYVLDPDCGLEDTQSHEV